MTAINEIPNVWFASSDEVNRMARDMVEAGQFDLHAYVESVDALRNLMDFIEKPYHWNRQHAWWVANDQPDDAESWERGHDTSWEITT